MAGRSELTDAACVMRRHVRAVLAGALYLSASGVVGAQARDVVAPRSSELTGTVVVTGSRLTGRDFAATSPVVALDSAAFEFSGDVQMEAVLNALPQMVPAITTTSNNPSNGGQANIDLRGLGTVRTLVLLDGVRMQPSNVNGVVDLNSIPLVLIDGVEILTGGASSVYGSDAIGGVINVRTLRRYSGMQASVKETVTHVGDGESFLAEVVLGGNFAESKGNALLALSYDRRDAVLAGEREFSAVSLGPSLAPSGSGTVPEGSISWGSNSPPQSTLDAVFGSYGAGARQVVPGNTLGFNADGSLFSFGSGTASNPVINFRGDTSDPGFNPLQFAYNFAPHNYLQLPLERRQIAALGSYQPGVPDSGEFYARLLFTSYEAATQLAATPVTCTGNAAGCRVPMSNTNIPPDLRTLAQSRPDPAADLFLSRRMTEVGARTNELHYGVFQGLVGARGHFDWIERPWRWDAHAAHGHTSQLAIQGGNLSRARLQAALTDPRVYATQGCPNFDPFGAGSLASPCASAVAIRATNRFDFERLGIVASLGGGFYALPAGPIEIVIGAEYREDQADFRPDEFLASGDVVGFNAQQPVSGRITVQEAFAEIAVPLLSEVAFAHYLGLEFAFRSSDYNIAGSYDTYKAAISWLPSDSIHLRASYNRAIRAPGIAELFLPRTENFAGHLDPCNVRGPFRYGADGLPGGSGANADGLSPHDVERLCMDQGVPAAALAAYQQPNGQARTIVGGNPELMPEIADTYTLGLSWQSLADQQWLAGLSASIDYFHYDIDDVIAALAATSIVSRCFNQLGTNAGYDNNDPSCRLFGRSPANFGITDVITTGVNLSTRRVRGYDANVAWKIPLSAFGAAQAAGNLDFRLLATRVSEWSQQETRADPLRSRGGTISNSVGSAIPEWKAALTVAWASEDVTLRYQLRYIAGMNVINNDALLTPSAGVAPAVPTRVYHDAALRWDLAEQFDVTVGVANLTDSDPPIYTTSSGAGVQDNTDPSTYDVLGRRYFANVTTRF